MSRAECVDNLLWKNVYLVLVGIIINSEIGRKVWGIVEKSARLDGKRCKISGI